MFLVLWSHSGHLLPDAWRPFLTPVWFRPGFWGVTIFFAISGFLVIGQLIDGVTGRRQETLQVFVFRRWLRTVPTYWILLSWLSGSGVVVRLGWKVFLPLSLLWVVLTAGYLIATNQVPPAGGA